MIRHSNKIAIAMSGGVDSSVAAYILKQQGFDVTGVNLNLWSCFKSPETQKCCSPEDRRDARKVCEVLGIPFVTVDMREEFKEKIVVDFAREYSKGRTPNPCIRCNTLIKFEAMLVWVEKELGISRLATGHYARIDRDKKGSHLKRGLDVTKDQSYFLFDISRETLAKLDFPLGGMKKSEARKIALEQKLPVAEKAESQDICFVTEDDFGAFIEDFYPEFAGGAGNFADLNGKIIGKHSGAHKYTIGQRRGLGIGFGKRKYVVRIDAEKGEVILGDDEDLLTNSCTLTNVRMLESMPEEFEADVKIRYKSPPFRAKVLCHCEPCTRRCKGEEQGDEATSRAKIIFTEPVRAITPGQAAVFYKDDLVLGGGWIE